MGFFLENNQGNKYILVAIDHYLKWCEAKVAAKCFEKNIICKYGVPKLILTYNGGERCVEFDNLCKIYGIQQQYTTPRWPWCNGMAERLINMIKHGITVMSTLHDNEKTWDFQLLKALFGYCYGI
jgi:hypothetical protein